VLQKQQQQAMAQKYSAFSQIQNNMTNKASVENAETLLNKGRDLQILGKHQEAISYYDKALAIEPNDLLALYGKGLALYELGKYDEAIASFDKALAIEPNNSLILKSKELVLAQK
jgi:tetratricopeptide (TPR) repeat protein